MRDTMTLSDDGLDLIKRFESFRPRPYLCPAGVPTIGYGCTIYEDGTAVSLDDGPITEAEADEMLRRLLGRYEAAVRRYAQVDLEQGQFDALVSFAYNVGNEALRGSTLLRLLNGGDVAGAANQFLRWDKAGGRTLPGLTRRRQAERRLFLGLGHSA